MSSLLKVTIDHCDCLPCRYLCAQQRKLLLYILIINCRNDPKVAVHVAVDLSKLATFALVRL